MLARIPRIGQCSGLYLKSRNIVPPNNKANRTEINVASCRGDDDFMKLAKYFEAKVK